MPSSDKAKSNTDPVRDLGTRWPVLQSSLSAIAQCIERLTDVFQSGGRLFVAGNGGSAADAIHIAGELVKAFELKRRLSESQAALFQEIPGGIELAQHLENGLPTFALGCNAALTSAIGNDFQVAHLEMAQELWVCGEKKDAFLGISTSGNSKNVRYAMGVSKAKQMLTIALTGPGPNPMSELADLAVTVPGGCVADIQDLHSVIYHVICRAIELHFFGE